MFALVNKSSGVLDEVEEVEVGLAFAGKLHGLHLFNLAVICCILGEDKWVSWWSQGESWGCC